MSGFLTARSFPRLRGRTRKSVLLVHLLSAAAWLGIDLALGVLVLTALLTDDPQVAGASLRLLATVAVWPMFTAGVVCLISGGVLGLGGRYGIVRYWWVLTKLAINVLFCTLIMMSLRYGLADAAETGRRMAAGDPAAEVPADLLGPTLVAPTLLLVAYLLSVFKPWGRIRRRPGRTAVAPIAADGAPDGISAGRRPRPDASAQSRGERAGARA